MMGTILIKNKIWPRTIIKDERVKKSSFKTLGLGEKDLNEYNFERFEIERDSYIKYLGH
jgi:hypothetical protein